MRPVGLSAVAAHLIVLVALASAGTLLVSAVNESISGQLDAQSLAFDRLRVQADADIRLASHGYSATPDRTYANWTNDGSREIPLDKVTLLVDGVFTSQASVATFEVREDASSNLWMPGETLEVMTEGQGNVDLTIVGPYANAAYRRA